MEAFRIDPDTTCSPAALSNGRVLGHSGRRTDACLSPDCYCFERCCALPRAKGLCRKPLAPARPIFSSRGILPNAKGSTPKSRNSISNWRSAMGFAIRLISRREAPAESRQMQSAYSRKDLTALLNRFCWSGMIFWTSGPRTSPRAAEAGHGSPMRASSGAGAPSLRGDRGAHAPRESFRAATGKPRA
jgi:hypothetical protein